MSTTGGGFTGWLFSDAPWAALGALISGITVWSLARNQRAARIVVREIARSSLVRVRPDVRERIGITFDHFPARNLSITDMTIANEGSAEIKGISLDLLFRSPARVLAVSASASEDDNTRGGWSWDMTEQKVTIHLPYLNRKESKQVVRFSIILDGDADGMVVRGGDAGWWVSHVPMASASQGFRRETNTLLAIAFLFFALGVYLAIFPTAKQSSDASQIILSVGGLLVGLVVVIGVWSVASPALKRIVRGMDDSPS